jgi:uncharacterized protein YjbI with pentapeptide repeats
MGNLRYGGCRGTLGWGNLVAEEEKPSTESGLRQTITTLLSIVSVLLVALGLIYTNAANRAQQRLAEQGQVTDRFATAIGQLDSGKLEIRLGGVYALERLIHDSPADKSKIIQVLSAFARDNTALKRKREQSSAPPLPTDVQAALTVVGTGNTAHDSHTSPIDLNHAPLTDAQLQYLYLAGANLSGAVLVGANLTYTYLNGANLSGADLTDAKMVNTVLSGANLSGADLTRAVLSHVNLDGAVLSHVKLIGASFSDADLKRVDLSGANLAGAVLVGADMPRLSLATADGTGADLSGTTLTYGYLVGAELDHAKFVNAGLTEADLTGADLTCADIRQANLKGANLSYSNLTDATFYAATITDTTSLAGANLTGTYWPQNARIPQGWRRNPLSPHHLERVGANQGGSQKINTPASC